MDYSYIFRSAKIKINSLKDAGFSKSDDSGYFLRLPVSNGDFYADFFLSPTSKNLTVQLFDSATSEKYALFDMNRAHGAFVASLREEVQKLVDRIKSSCFESHDLKDEYLGWLSSRFSAWHMNKKHWITVLLTAATDFERLRELTESSYELVSR